MKLFPSFANWRSGIISALTRFPWNILCGIGGAAAMIVWLHRSGNEWLTGQCFRFAMTAAVGMPLFFSLRILRERSRRMQRWPIEVAGLPLLVAWFFAQPGRPFDAPSIVAVRWLLLLAALHFFAAVSAFVRDKERLGFWQFNRRLFLRFCLATLYTAVLTVGFELALLSADKLFDLKLDKPYGDLFFLMIGVFHPAFFLAGVPRDFVALNAESDYPRGLKAFTQFALAPLVAVYTAILYAYAVKIIANWSWPHGWVALPVLLLSGVGILTFLLLYPLRARKGEKWARWFSINFPRALAPLALLLLLSLHVRITEYGITEQRYLGVILGVWILAWALVFILRQQAGIRWVPSSLALICVLAGFGPWSAGSVSKQSQLQRIKHILQKNGLWGIDQAKSSDQSAVFSQSDKKDLEDTLSYLIRVHGGHSLKSYFASVLPSEDWSALTGWRGVHDVMAALNLEASSPVVPWSAPTDLQQQEIAAYLRVTRKQQGFLDVHGFRRAWRVPLYAGSRSGWSPSTYDDVKIGQDNGLLKLATAEEPTPKEIPLKDLLSNLKSENEMELPNENLTVDFWHGKRAFRVVFDSIALEKDSLTARIDHCTLYLLEK